MASGADVHADFALEEVDVAARNLTVAAWIGAAAQAFFFVSFLFAFFYLRALNTNHRWNTHDVHPSRAYGVVILLCMLGSVGACWAGAWASRTANGGLWRAGMPVAILLALAVVGVQCAQYANLGFSAEDGSFPSVFLGWTGLLTLNVLAVAYWLGTLFAETRRAAGRTLELIRPSAEALAIYWALLGLVEVVAFVLLYFVA